jgi:hypothetical protein
VFWEVFGATMIWEKVVRRRDRYDIVSWNRLSNIPTHLVTSISNHEMRQRLKKAPCFGGAQPRLGQGTAIHRHARQTVTRDGEDPSFKWETAKTKRRSRSFVILLLIHRSKNFTSLASLLKVQQHLQQFSTSHFLNLSSPFPPNLPFYTSLLSVSPP